MTEQINEAGYIKGVQVLTEKEQLSKDKLQEFIKDHPILKQQEKFEKMEKALQEIIDIEIKADLAFPDSLNLHYAHCIAREALKED